MALKGLLLLAGMVIVPYAAGFVNHDLQMVLVGVDIGVIGTFVYSLFAMYYKVTGMAKDLKKELNRAGIHFEAPKKK